MFHISISGKKFKNIYNSLGGQVVSHTHSKGRCITYTFKLKKMTYHIVSWLSCQIVNHIGTYKLSFILPRVVRVFSIKLISNN